MIEKYHEPILALLTEKGEMGVNGIATATGIPLSTVQKYLSEQQKYFRKTANRKWDIPERVTVGVTDNAITAAVGIMENSLSLFQAQLEEILIAAGNLSVPLNTLKRASGNQPVVSVKPKLNIEIEKMVTQVEYIKGAMKEYEKKIPDDYKELFTNLDLYAFHTQEGFRYIREVFHPQFSEMILSEVELTDELVSVLEQYQFE